MQPVAQQGDRRWLKRAVDATIVGLLAGLAFIEFAPRYFPDIAVEPAQYRLFEFHLALNAVLLVGAGYYLKKGGLSGNLLQRIVPVFLIYMPLWGLAFVNGILVGRSLFTLDVEKIWIALLALPAVVNFFTAPAMLEERQAEKADDSFDHESEGAQTARNAGAENVSAFDIWQRHFYSAIYQAAYYAFFLLLLGFGSFYYYLLDALLLAGRIISLEQIKNAAPAVFENILPYLIALPLVIAAITIIIGLFSATYHSFLQNRHPMMDRDLTASEAGYIESGYEQLVSYLENQKYPRAYDFIYYGGAFVLPLVWMGIMAGGSVLLVSYFNSIYEAERTANATIYIYGDFDTGWSALVGVFSGIFMLWASYQAAGRFAPRFAEYAFISGWNTADGHDRTADEYFNTIGKFVRIGALQIDQSFDPSNFLLLAFKEYEKLVYGVTLALLIINAWFLFLDVKSYHLFADDRIEYSDYFTTRSYRIGYDDVREVKLSCYTFTHDGEKGIRHAYSVVLDDAHMINIFAESKFEQEDFVAFDAIDQKLKTAAVQFTREELRGWPKRDKIAFDDNCREILVNEYGVEKGAVIANLLRADE